MYFYSGKLRELSHEDHRHGNGTNWHRGVPCDIHFPGIPPVHTPAEGDYGRPTFDGIHIITWMGTGLSETQYSH